MKIVGIIASSALLVLLGIAVPSYAQRDEQHEENKPEQHAQQPQQRQQSQQAQKQPQHAQQTQPAQKAQPAQRSQQAQQKQQPRQTQQPQQAQRAQPAQRTQQTQQRQQAQQQQHAPQAQQAQKAQSTQHTQQAQRSGSSPRAQLASASRQSTRYTNHGGRIPDDRFRSNFGREHRFRINTPFVVGGYSRFQYGGFWFGMYDPWPVGWYDTDDLYVDSIGGVYYLYDQNQPGARISINVVL